MRKLLFTFSLLILFLIPETSLAASNSSASIQQLIDQADDGDIIQLKGQMYDGDIVIDKPISLRGAGNTLIKGSGKESVITITADNVTIENTTIQNSGTSLDNDAAGIKIQSKKNQIVNNKIKDSLHGIYLQESNENDISENDIFGNTSLTTSRRGNGIHLYHSHENNIEKNQIKESRDGIYFSFSEENNVKGNKISKTRYGLHYMYSDHNTFYQNDFFENIGGAAIMHSDHINLEENMFHDHQDLQSFGILLKTAKDVTLEGNKIQFNQKGVFMDQSDRNVLINNSITNNRIGLDVWGSSTNNAFSNNAITDNKITYSSNNNNDKNEWSIDGVGNEWSGQALTDLDQDGIGDKPFTTHSSFGQIMADQQLGALFLESPALAIYEKWNAIFDEGDKGVVDPHPIKVNQQPISRIQMMGFLFFVLTVMGILVWRRQNIKKGR